MIKKYLATGFITLLPIALTLMIVSWLFNFFTTPLLGITENLLLAYQHKTGLNLESHETLVIFISRVMALILLFALTMILGFLGRKIFFKTFISSTHYLFLKLPFVKAVYRISKEVTGAIFSQSTKTFKKTVLIPFPHLEAHTLGFITGDAPAVCKKAVFDVDQSIFVPTSPHPLSGYMLLSPKKNVMEVDVSVEDAFKFLLSCGAVHPGENISQTSDPSKKP
ncbi:MAG: DUF502 domain-containing protein [Chlamydiales bacterium]|nr:DUF502 domain-containing protein [Chlamydiales bacterium]